LALGAVLGWPIALRHISPNALGRLGITSPKRVLQAHIDFIMMGIILIAVGAAVPALPTWIAVSLAFGAIVNPLLFLPLAFRESWSKALPYQAASIISFTAMSIGTVAAAWHATTL